LLTAALAALLLANSPWKAGFEGIWTTELGLDVGGWDFTLDLRHWINEGLMAVFFVVVGLEIKRELFEGELRDRRHAALPVVAAIGGMLVPAAIFLALNAGGPAHRGWGIPMATDIAFALGVAAVVARGLPSSVRLFLLTLAIVDDIGAIIVIAVFYAGGIEWTWLEGAVVIIASAYLTVRSRVVWPPLFVLFGVATWFALHQAGVHATIAGVVMGLLAPTAPKLSREIVINRGDELLDVFSPEAAKETSRLARQSVSTVEWLQHGLHPWSSIVVVPAFALANAGVELSGSAFRSAAASRVTWGVMLGLVAGKWVGVVLFSWLAVRSRLARLPSESRWPEVMGAAALAGIGFTVSLFITDLAFGGPLQTEHLMNAKIAIIASSVLATIAGAAILRRSAR
jgi:NhaA family Na+:H+ antiporter